MGITGGPPLKKNLSASASEVKTFIASLKGKSPAEAMGMVTRSKLVRAIGISLVVQIAVLLLFTLPYIGKGDRPQKPATPAAQAAPAPAPAAPPTTKKATAAQPKDNGNNVTKNWDAKGPSETPTFRDDILKDNR